MTIDAIDEGIRYCEETAHNNEILMNRYDSASGYNRSHNEDIRTAGAKGCERHMKVHRQLAEWLRELKIYKSQRPQGEWIDTHFTDEWYGGIYQCSICGEEMIGRYSYCPGCGAEMKKEIKNDKSRSK